jgi:hypothetical protein
MERKGDVHAFICIVSFLPKRKKAKLDMRKRDDAFPVLQAQEKTYEKAVLFLGL